MKSFSFFLLMVIPLVASAQFSDDFADGDFTANPAWTGDVTEFKISTLFQMQLNQEVPPPAGVSDTSYLATVSETSDSAEWTFYVRLSFTPSDNNYARIYLMSDQDNLKAPLHGYYIQLGESGSFDSVDLFRQDGDNSIRIIDGIDSHCSASSNTLGIKVIRHSSGLWELLSDITGGLNFQTEGTVVDNTFNSSSYFGIFCKYSSSNTTKFFFDDLYAGNILVDLTPPQITYLQVINVQQVDIGYSENVADESALEVSNYYSDNGLGNPDTAIADIYGNSVVHLIFCTEIQPGLEYTMLVQHIRDQSNNFMPDTTVNFLFYQPQLSDIVINEIMADPNPAVDLPAYEYIELYNCSDYDLTMAEWSLTAGQTTRTIPEVTIRPDSFLILCSSTAFPELSIYGKTLGISGFPSLTNTGGTISVNDSNGTNISTVSYAVEWYQDALKEDGGWSLEKIDPHNNCSEMTNWRASVDSSGGTPGRQNSIYASNTDNQPPSLVALEVNDHGIIILVFSETLQDSVALDISHYSAGNGIGMPDSIVLAGEYHEIVQLYFPVSFTSGEDNFIQIIDIPDICNNFLDTMTIEFTYYNPVEFDIVINEIMADPEPVVGLPEADYIELYNNSAFDISLTGWSITTGSVKKCFPFIIMKSGEFLLITFPDAVDELSIYGNTTGIITSTDLTNEGKTLTLKDRNDRVISNVTYSPDWYQTVGKDEGGWSLEQIDPGNPCGGKSNWLASCNVNGGTPGAQNSVFAANPDIVAPSLLRATVISAHTIRLFFSEPLDSLSLFDKYSYLTDNGSGNPENIVASGPDYNCVTLTYPHDFTENIIYTICVTSEIRDCTGNMIANGTSACFAIPSPVEPSDIVINEILFDPRDDCVDFVEIYNRSAKTITLDEIITGSMNSSSDIDTDTIPEEKYLFFPSDYLVLTTDPEKVKEQYFTHFPSRFICMNAMPAFSNDSGRVLIMTRGYVIIDDFTYDKDMHFALLNNTEGVSLERVNYDQPTNDRSNWHSAAETAGFATPAYKNSQYSEGNNEGGNISLSPEVFSPNNDGIDDYLNIQYQFDSPGYTGTIIIFDANGRTIKNLVNQELLATEGTFTWDGLNDSEQRARIGIYLVFTEVFDLKGNVKKFKKTCVLAGKM